MAVASEVSLWIDEFHDWEVLPGCFSHRSFEIVFKSRSRPLYTSAKFSSSPGPRMTLGSSRYSSNHAWWARQPASLSAHVSVSQIAQREHRHLFQAIIYSTIQSRVREVHVRENSFNESVFEHSRASVHTAKAEAKQSPLARKRFHAIIPPRSKDDVQLTWHNPRLRTADPWPISMVS